MHNEIVFFTSQVYESFITHMHPPNTHTFLSLPSDFLPFPPSLPFHLSFPPCVCACVVKIRLRKTRKLSAEFLHYCLISLPILFSPQPSMSKKANANACYSELK